MCIADALSTFIFFQIHKWCIMMNCLIRALNLVRISVVPSGITFTFSLSSCQCWEGCHPPVVVLCPIMPGTILDSLRTAQPTVLKGSIKHRYDMILIEFHHCHYTVALQRTARSYSHTESDYSGQPITHATLAMHMSRYRS